MMHRWSIGAFAVIHRIPEEVHKIIVHFQEIFQIQTIQTAYQFRMLILPITI